MDETEMPAMPWWGLVGAGLAVLALALEVARVTLSWPNPVRSLWWVLATASLAGYHVARRRSGDRTSVVLAVLSVAAFATFTVGVVLAAEWAAWH